MASRLQPHLSPFEPGYHTASKFAASSASRAPIVFTSSVATVQRWPLSRGMLIPETSHSADLSLCTRGYGSSKLAAQRIFEHAARDMGVRSAILRIGQIPGPVTHCTSGMWSKHEWLPSLIASSKYLGMLPDDLGLAINWVPVDF